jgi:hypothetical protein
MNIGSFGKGLRPWRPLPKRLTMESRVEAADPQKAADKHSLDNSIGGVRIS